MSAAFIRCLWGSYSTEPGWRGKCRSKMDRDIQRCLKAKRKIQFNTYVFGEENFKMLIGNGLTNCTLVDKKATVWSTQTQMFRHKLEAFRLGMQDFDKIVFLDWDVFLLCPLPPDFWKILGRKQPIQAVLRQYAKSMAPWRTQDHKQIPSASFVYIRDKQIPHDLISVWERLGCGMSEEVPMAKYTDDLLGGWKGANTYWDNFEPMVCDLGASKKYAVFTQRDVSQKQRIFGNFNTMEKVNV